MSDSDSVSDVSFDESASTTDEEDFEKDQNDSNDITENNGNEDNEEDEIFKKFKKEQQKQRNHPPDIEFEDHIVDICFHPTDNLIAIANIVGDVNICKYSKEENNVIDTWELHVQACRDIEFDGEGNILYSTSKDRTLMITDVKTGKLKAFVDDAHEVPINCLQVIDEDLIASGDDDGRIRFWDLRNNTKTPIYQTKKHDDFISDMVVDDHKTYLICASGDGTISSIDLKNRSFFLQSEEYDEEFTSLGIFRQGNKLLASTSKGKMYLFNWREFGYHSDEFPGPKQSINKIIPITQNIVVTGNEDGILRGTHLFPHRQLGIVGQHKLSIECMDICNDGTLIASSSLRNEVKFWNISYFDHFRLANLKEKKNKKQLTNNLPSSKQTNRKDFFADLGT